MSLMDNPMDGLLGFQQALNEGMPVNKLDANYVIFHDKTESGNRYSFAKVIDGEAQSLATFGQEEPIKGLDCYSINYSVNEKYRGRGLAVETVNKGIEELKKKFSRSFFVDAIIDETNIHSINVAKKIFSNSGINTNDHLSGAPSLLFHKLIRL